MKVGTDGVLLGAWASVCHEKNTDSGNPFSVLDIGTGTGIISLMICQRLTNEHIDCKIDAIEIDADAANQAKENFNASPWEAKLRVFPQSLQDFQAHDEEEPERKYQLIVSNPPFYNATLKPEDKGRAVARHKDSLPVADIARFARQHLTPNGRLALIYPTDYDSEVMTAVTLCQLYLVRICDILTKEGKPCKRKMVEFSPTAQTIVREQLAIRDSEGKYTLPYLALTEDFYLHLSD